MPKSKWTPNCLRGSIPREIPIDPGHTDSNLHSDHDDNDEWKGSLILTLQKREGCSLGLTVSGGVDKDQKPYVANLRPGSIAHRCDSLMVGDTIVSVNEIRTTGLRHEEIINLLKNAGVNVTVEIEYRIPNTGPLGNNIQVKQYEVILDKEPSGFGLTLRGGMLVESMRCHPLTVVAIRAGGPGHREGSIKVGDQILSVNGYKVTHLSLGESLGLLSQCEALASFTVAYETAIIEGIETATGPLSIEIDRYPGSDIGVELSSASYNKKPCMCVGYLQPMSIADRSGALREGDYMLSIDGVSVEAMSLAEASQLLKAGPSNSVHVEIVPVAHLEHCANREILNNTSLSQSLSSHSGLHLSNKSAIIKNNYNSNSLNRKHPQHSHSSGSSGAGGVGSSSSSSGNNSNTFNSRHSYVHSYADSNSMSVGLSPFGTLNLGKQRNNWEQGVGRRATSCMSIASSSASVLSNANHVCHTETLEVILFADQRGMLGLTLKGGLVPSLPMAQPPSISFVEQRSPADKCGVLQAGDRILAINGLKTLDRTLEEVNRFLRDSRPRCVLLVEFDVTESVIPSCGTFVVKLVKRTGETGITINTSTSNTTEHDSLFISDVRRGSVAHRCGSIQAGDKLLSINDVKLDRCTNDDAMHLLELPDDIVKLKLSRDDPDDGHEGFIIYTVELQRYGGPLGITISGTEDPYDPIIISELMPHGLAEKTGAIHIGDRLLAVSGDTTKNKPLSEAIRMLQDAGDIVTLKIARPDPASDQDELTLQPFDFGCSTPIPSVDSAMESWNSSALDLGSLNHNGVYTAGRATPTNTNHLHEESGGMVLAIPKSDNHDSQWPQTDSDHDQEHLNGGIMSFNGDDSEPRERSGEDDCNDSDCNSSTIEEWVKTLEDLDIGSGSEMLRQIGVSLRQRSEISLDERSPSSSISNHRSQSTSRIGRGRIPSNSHSVLNPHSSSIQLNSPEAVGPGHGKIRDMNRSVSDVYSLPMKKLNKPAIAPKPAKLTKSKSSMSPPSSTLSTSQDLMSSPLTTFSNGLGKENQHQTKTIFTPSPIQLQKVSLEKHTTMEGFGFSLSDGLYERGVYISAITKDSPAERAGLRQYDKILQVGKIKVQDEDCKHVVPLMAECGNKMRLIVCRNPLLRLSNSVQQEGLVSRGGHSRLAESQTSRGRERARRGAR